MPSENQKFNEWNKIKKKLHHSENMPHFSEGQIWWCGVGKNIGVEMNGKSEKFSRPILIFKKLNRFCFLAIPLTSQPKTGPWYVSFNFRNRKNCAVLIQAKVMDVKRLYSRIGEIDEEDYRKIQNGFYDLFLKNIPKP